MSRTAAPRSGAPTRHSSSRRTGDPSRRGADNRPARPGSDHRGSDHHRGSAPRGSDHQGSGHRNSAPRGRAPQATPRPRTNGWLDQLPVQVVATENLPGFRELGLPRGLVNALGRAGIATPFPIQAATIPAALAGRDVLGRAATGSGKTLGFGLPLIARLEGSTSAPRRPRGLVLVPTRELAMQVNDALAPLAQARELSVRLVAGGLAIGKQISALERGVDILVATPGRLVDLLERNSCSLGDVEVTVLDEADHMADMGFLPVVRRLLDLTPAGGQRLLFSATLDGDVATLVQAYLSDPAVFALHASTASVDTMTHHLLRVSHEAKNDVVTAVSTRRGRTLLFVRTKHGADRLAKNLATAGVRAGVLHGGRSQSQRSRALESFKASDDGVLVATDVAARGIHVDGVSLVVHVDPPADPKDYLHRSGRTARAGESGTVLTLVMPTQEREVGSMLSAAGVHAVRRDATDDTLREVAGSRTALGERPGPSVVVTAAPRPAGEVSRRRGPAGRPAGAPSGRPRRPRTTSGR